MEDFRSTLKKGKRDLSRGKSQKETIRKETSKTRLNQLKNEYHQSLSANARIV